MKCFDCKEHEAEFVLIEYEQVEPLCDGCMHERIHMDGEINLDFWHIDNLETIFKEINKNLKYVWGKYARFLEEYDALKKESEGLNKTPAPKVNENG